MNKKDIKYPVDMTNILTGDVLRFSSPFTATVVYKSPYFQLGHYVSYPLNHEFINLVSIYMEYYEVKK